MTNDLWGDLIAEATYPKRIEAFKRGGYFGGFLPLGVKVLDGKVVEDETETSWVEYFFTAVDQGATIADLERWTVEKGITCKKWHNNRRDIGLDDLTIKRILTNPFYATGNLEYHFKWMGRNERISQHINLSKPIPEDSFHRIQQILQARRPGRPVDSDWLLSGVLFYVKTQVVDREDLGQIDVQSQEAKAKIAEYFWLDESDRASLDQMSKVEIGLCATVTSTRYPFRAMTKSNTLRRCYYCQQWGRDRRAMDLVPNGSRPITAEVDKNLIEAIVWRQLRRIREDPEEIYRQIDEKNRLAGQETQIMQANFIQKQGEL